MFSLIKQAGRVNGKNTHQNYQEGDNDLYWLNCKNGKFYVIPEIVMIENELVGKNCKKNKLYVSPTNQNTSWCNKYLFDYHHFTEQDKFRLENIIFGQNAKT